jgi:hypothetical protein
MKNPHPVQTGGGLKSRGRVTVIPLQESHHIPGKSEAAPVRLVSSVEAELSRAKQDLKRQSRTINALSSRKRAREDTSPTPPPKKRRTTQKKKTKKKSVKNIRDVYSEL